MSVRWETSTTSRKIGTKVSIDKATGQPRISARTGKPIRIPETKKNVPYDFPIVEADSPEEFTVGIHEMLAKKVAGYDSWAKVHAHLLYGLKRHVATLLNQGKDVRLSPAQLQALEMYVKLVQMPGSAMTREDAIKFLTVQGIENASEAFDGFMADDDEDNEDNPE